MRRIAVTDPGNYSNAVEYNVYSPNSRFRRDEDIVTTKMGEERDSGPRSSH